jgi:hypothetical protein
MLSLPLILAALAAVSPLQDPPADSSKPKPIRALVIEQEANGLPNQPTDEPVLQRIIIAEDRLLLEDPHSGVAYQLRLDRNPPTLIEVSSDRKHYREGRQLDQLQKERDRQERQTLEKLENEPAIRRRTVMEELHLRPGLEREVTVEHFPDQSREILGREAHRVLVRENGRVIVDAWIAPNEFGIPFFEFYRRVGAFSEAVLEKLRTLEGLPLEVDFAVVTQTLTHKIQVRARKITPEEVPPHIFEIPLGAERIVESKIAHCPICGHEVEKAGPPAGKSLMRTGAEVYFDRRECKIEFNRREYPEKFPRPKTAKKP